VTKPPLRVLLVAGVVLLGGCSSTGTPTSKPSASITVRLELSRTTVKAGTPIKGVAVITNNTTQPIRIKNYQCTVDGRLAVGLVNQHVSFYPGFAASACSGPEALLEPGSGRYQFTIYTTYLGCSPTAADSIEPNPIICTPHGIPPLPVGHYTTKIVLLGFPKSTEFPPPTAVTLLAPTS